MGAFAHATTTEPEAVQPGIGVSEELQRATLTNRMKSAKRRQGGPVAHPSSTLVSSNDTRGVDGPRQPETAALS